MWRATPDKPGDDQRTQACWRNTRPERAGGEAGGQRQGVSSSALQRRDAFGVMGMRERAKQSRRLSLRYAAEPGQGTRLTLCIPLAS